MNFPTVTVSAVIDAPAPVLYGIISDYRDGHPRIVPKPPFDWIQVESGGKGAGTVIRFPMRFFGVTRMLRAAVTEPEPGRVLVETDLDNGTVSTFTVLPISENRAEVRIHTELRGKPGLFGTLERSLAKRLLGPVYARELAQLAAVAKDWPAHEGRSGRRDRGIRWPPLTS